MKVDYATIRIKVKADEEEINTNELALSDTLMEIVNELEGWLCRPALEGDRFNFEIEVV